MLRPSQPFGLGHQCVFSWIARHTGRPGHILGQAVVAEGAQCSAGTVCILANGGGSPDGQHNTAAAYNASNGGDNFGLNWGLNGPPKPAHTAAAQIQAVVGRRDLTGRIQPTPPPQMYLDERRRGGGGSGDANLTYILAFAAQHPVGSFATVAPQPPGTQPEAFSVDSLQMTGAVVQQTGAGNRTSCPGFLARVQLPTTAGDAKGHLLSTSGWRPMLRRHRC